MNICEVIKIAPSSETVSLVGLCSIFYSNIFLKYLHWQMRLISFVKREKSLYM